MGVDEWIDWPLRQQEETVLDLIFISSYSAFGYEGQTIEIGIREWPVKAAYQINMKLETNYQPHWLIYLRLLLSILRFDYLVI